MEKIDFVVLWVDGSDPKWLSERKKYCPSNKNNGCNLNRYRDWGLMKYWFRGVENFAPWVNRIFLVTNGQKPEWLNLQHPKLRFVCHQEYIPEKYLPTFNSNVIELWLHRIPDLSEKFVLFNDDMFLTSPVAPYDFFREGLPCEAALMDLITSPGPEDCLPYMLANNFSLINKYYDKKTVLKQNKKKFFYIGYRTDIIRNFLLCPFQYFSCFRDTHLPSSYLKSTFETLWRKEGEMLEACSEHKFRSKEDLTHWLMKAWQICEGKFVPRPKNWGHHYELWEDPVEKICYEIERQKYCAVCINDSKEDIEFESIRYQLIESFEHILSEKSKFER